MARINNKSPLLAKHRPVMPSTSTIVTIWSQGKAEIDSQQELSSKQLQSNSNSLLGGVMGCKVRRN